jgi:hypothetical protein
MSDPTEAARRELIPTMPAEALAAAERGEPVWTTDEMTAEFEAIGFLAPFVMVRRRSDGVKGTLMFSGRPRFYFGFAEA